MPWREQSTPKKHGRPSSLPAMAPIEIASCAIDVEYLWISLVSMPRLQHISPAGITFIFQLLNKGSLGFSPSILSIHVRAHWHVAMLRLHWWWRCRSQHPSCHFPESSRKRSARPWPFYLSEKLWSSHHLFGKSIERLRCHSGSTKSQKKHTSI